MLQSFSATPLNTEKSNLKECCVLDLIWTLEANNAEGNFCFIEAWNLQFAKILFISVIWFIYVSIIYQLYYFFAFNRIFFFLLSFTLWCTGVRDRFFVIHYDVWFFFFFFYEQQMCFGKTLFSRLFSWLLSCTECKMKTTQKDCLVQNSIQGQESCTESWLWPDFLYSTRQN